VLKRVAGGWTFCIAPGVKYNRSAGIRMATEVGSVTAGRFEMFHAELVDPRAKTPHSVIWGQNYGIVVNEDCERFYDEGEDYLFVTTQAIAHDTWSPNHSRNRPRQPGRSFLRPDALV
jgi:hypothetical protein